MNLKQEMTETNKSQGKKIKIEDNLKDKTYLKTIMLQPKKQPIDKGTNI